MKRKRRVRETAFNAYAALTPRGAGCFRFGTGDCCIDARRRSVADAATAMTSKRARGNGILWAPKAGRDQALPPPLVRQGMPLGEDRVLGTSHRAPREIAGLLVRATHGEDVQGRIGVRNRLSGPLNWRGFVSRRGG